MSPLGLAAFDYDVAHLAGALVLLAAFGLLYQRRLPGMINLFALQSAALGSAAAWQAWVQDAAQLYTTAAIVWTLKTAAVPLGLHWLIRRLRTTRTVETALGIGPTMIAGVALVALAVLMVTPIGAARSALAREELALALSVILLGLLIMITRRHAVSQVIGFMCIENGVTLAVVSIKGMPLVVEMSVAFSVMVAFILFGIFFFQIRERFDTLDLHFLESFRGEDR
jgi:hydrogenase-4 component E